MKKTFQTSKLYYNKYPCKLTIELPQGVAKYYNSKVFYVASKLKKGDTHTSRIISALNHPEQMSGVRFMRVSEPPHSWKSQKSVQKRGSMVFYSVFLSESACSFLENEVPEIIVDVHRPAEGCIDLLKPNVVLVDTLPHGGYQYKVWLRRRSPEEKLRRVVNWVNGNETTDLIKVASYGGIDGFPTYAPWMEKVFWIKDEKTYVVLALILDSSIRRVVHYKVPVVAVEENQQEEVNTQ